jgi:MFS family permease
MFAEDTLGVSKTVGDILGPCIFALFMGIGRILMGVFSHRINTRKTLATSSVLLVFSVLIITLPQNVYLSFLGMALFGLGVSIGWPGSLNLASEKNKNGGGPMFALMSIGGDLGCASGPFLVGIISEFTSGSLLGEMKTGLLASVIFPVVALMLLMLLKERKN